MSECTRAKVRIELLATDKGGRSSPILPGYRPHFRIRNGNGEYLGVQFVDFTSDLVRPGNSTLAPIQFAYEPEVDYSAALVVDAEFDIMEGGKVVGAGKVTSKVSGESSD